MARDTCFIARVEHTRSKEDCLFGRSELGGPTLLFDFEIGHIPAKSFREDGDPSLYKPRPAYARAQLLRDKEVRVVFSRRRVHKRAVPAENATRPSCFFSSSFRRSRPSLSQGRATMMRKEGAQPRRPAGIYVSHRRPLRRLFCHTLVPSPIRGGARLARSVPRHVRVGPRAPGGRDRRARVARRRDEDVQGALRRRRVRRGLFVCLFGLFVRS